MFIGCLAVLMTAGGFLTEMPPSLEARLSATNEVKGTFIQTKRFPNDRALVSKGTFHRTADGRFEWRTCEPFETVFWADQVKYCYSNEDECVEKPLKELPGYGRFMTAAKGDYSAFFAAFDALYREEAHTFHLLAKPKDPRLKRRLSRIELDGTVTNLLFRATFPDKTRIEIQLNDAPTPCPKEL